MLTIKVTEQNVEIITSKDFVAGTVGAKCKITFVDFWTDYNKTIVFNRLGKNGGAYNLPIVEMEAEYTIPWEIMTESGRFKIGAYGTDEDEVLPTLWSDSIRVVSGTTTDGMDPQLPTPSEYQQLIALASEAVKTVESLREDAANGNFNGEKGDKGDPGAITFIVLPELPEVGDGSIMYLIPNDNAEGQNNYDEYIYANNVWEKIGTTSVEVDLTEYVKKDQIATYQTAGLVKPASWTGIILSNPDGTIALADCVKAHIERKGSDGQRVAVTTKMLDYAVKKALCDCKLSGEDIWTDEEKQSARDLIDTVGTSTDEGGEIFGDYENNKALSEFSTAFSTGSTAGTMGYEIQYISPDYLRDQPDLLFLFKDAMGETAESLVEEINKCKNELVSIIAGNNYDCVGTLQEAYYIPGDPNFGIIIRLLDDPESISWDKSKFPPKNKAYIYFPNKPRVGDVVVNTAPAFVAGVNSVASQEASAAFGEGCVAAGKRSFVAGKGNIAGYISAAFGRDNKSRGQYGFASGYKNDIATNVLQGTVFGESNNVRSRNTLIEGHNNKDGYFQAMGANHLEGINNTIADNSYGTIHLEGEDNIVKSDGQASHIEGKNNQLISGKVNHIEGISNKVDGGYNHIEGSLNSITGTYNDVGGTNNSVINNGARNFVRGSGNSVSGDDKAVFGINALDIANALLIIGNGEYVGNNRNAFAVLKDGSARIQTESTQADAVVRYSQLKAALDRIAELESKLSNI